MLNRLNRLRCLRNLLDLHMYNPHNSRCRGPSSRLPSTPSIMRTTSPNLKLTMRFLVPMRHRSLGTRSAVSTLGSSILNSLRINHISDILRRSTSLQWNQDSPTCRLHFHAQLRLGLRTPKL